jgi:hypothetical protein
LKLILSAPDETAIRAQSNLPVFGAPEQIRPLVPLARAGERN